MSGSYTWRRSVAPAPAPAISRRIFQEPKPSVMRGDHPIEVVHHCTAPETRKHVWSYPCDCIRDSVATCQCAAEFDELLCDTIQIRITDACCRLVHMTNLLP